MLGVFGRQSFVADHHGDIQLSTPAPRVKEIVVERRKHRIIHVLPKPRSVLRAAGDEELGAAVAVAHAREHQAGIQQRLLAGQGPAAQAAKRPCAVICGR